MTQPTLPTQPTLSVVVANYNHAAYLRQCLDSLVGQSRTPDELIVLDDASTDESVEIIESYVARHPYIRLIRRRANQGAVAALRELTAAAKGDYLFTGAADDFYFPSFFARAMQAAVDHPQAGIVFGKLIAVDERGRKLRDVPAPSWQVPQYVAPERYLDEYLERTPVYQSLTPATIYRRACLEEVGGFRAELGHWCDTFAVRSIALKYGAVYVPETFAAWRRLTTSLSHGAQRALARNQAVVDRAAALMRSPEFRDRFPERHVGRWRRRYRCVNVLLYLRSIAHGWRPPAKAPLPARYAA